MRPAGLRDSGVLVATAAFALAFGQPVVVTALALFPPSLASLPVIVGGTVALGVAAARASAGTDGSVDRRVDFVLWLAVVQLVLVVVVQVVVTPLALTAR